MKTAKTAIACILLASAATGAAFAADPYIASTADGTFYAIDTGFTPGPDTKIFADFEFVGDVAIVGESVSCEVENVPLGMKVIIR